MTPSTVLGWVVIAEGMILIDAVIILLGHALWWRWYQAARGAYVPRARAALAAMLERADDNAAVEMMRLLPVRVRIRLLVDVARTLTGARHSALGSVARALGLTEVALGWCRSRLWWRRLHGARFLTMLDDGQSLVPALFADPHPAVRAQATEWAPAHRSPEVIGALLAMLTDPFGACRFAARDALLRLGDAAIEPVVRYLAARRDHDLTGALEVAIGLADPRFLGSALALFEHDRPAVRARVAVLLGAIGGTEGASILLAYLTDDDETVRAAAAQALGKLGHWPAATFLADMLRDSAWVVRREAGLALRALGAPGTVCLRRLLSDADRFAADMARQALDFPKAAWKPVTPLP